jgi:Domain of unknown function (DUF4159)
MRRGLATTGAVLLLTVAAMAQRPFRERGFRGERSGDPPAHESNVSYDGRFVFVRLRYAMDSGSFFRREPMWAHDYPRGERHFMKILNELTLLGPHVDESNILALDDPELFKFPIAYMAEPGYWTMTEEEVTAFRAYLQKGGFAIFDDFRAEHWTNFEAQMRRVMSDLRWIELDGTHPVFHSFFEIDAPLEFIPPYGGLKPIFYGLFEDNDPTKRMLAVANYNNDLSEYWEFSDTGFTPIELSNEAYKFGVNYVIYALTH